jgi:hypothetical protein
MGFTITNTSDGPVLVRLRSGATLHLAAREQSQVLEDPDVRNNPRLEDLLARQLVELQEVSPTATARARRDTAPAGGSRRTRPRGSRQAGGQGDSG